MDPANIFAERVGNFERGNIFSLPSESVSDSVNESDRVVWRHLEQISRVEIRVALAEDVSQDLFFRFLLVFVISIEGNIVSNFANKEA